jgi:hypothetical protein
MQHAGVRGRDRQIDVLIPRSGDPQERKAESKRFFSFPPCAKAEMQNAVAID